MRQCVAPQTEIQVGGEIHLQLSRILSRKPCLGREIVVEGVAQRLDELSSYAHRVLVPLAHDHLLLSVLSSSHEVGHGEFPQLM